MLELFTFDSLTAVSSAIFCALAVATLIAAPRRDRDFGQLAAVACVAIGTLVSYMAGSLWLFAAGWVLSALPFMAGLGATGPRVAMAASSLALIAGAFAASLSGAGAHLAAFVLLAAAFLIRKGIFPFHSWVLNGFERGPLLPLGLLLNGHLGAFLLIRFVIPQFADVARQALPMLSILALGSSLYTALLAISQTAPLRILALLSISQSAFILAGIESRNQIGIAGAMVHSTVVAVATTGLYLAYRAIEARYSRASTEQGYLGLVTHAPRLAAFFALCGLALIGLPGTLGFAAEDLLFHGSLESQPLLGIALPLATALNAITMYRLFSRLFLGRATRATPAIPDALPRERWVLAAAVVFLVWFGVAPSGLVNARGATAASLAEVLEKP